MRVLINEKRLSDLDPATGQHYLLAEGDTITVPDDVGARWCAYGWASDVEGKVATGERVEGAREVIAHDLNLSAE